MHFEKESDMEGLRIPHFYNAFYVYKYATGISASLALAKRVTEGGDREREDYFKFLKSGSAAGPSRMWRVFRRTSQPSPGISTGFWKTPMPP